MQTSAISKKQGDEIMTAERLTPDMKLEILYNREKWSEIYAYVKRTMDKPLNERKHILKQWKG